MTRWWKRRRRAASTLSCWVILSRHQSLPPPPFFFVVSGSHSHPPFRRVVASSCCRRCCAARGALGRSQQRGVAAVPLLRLLLPLPPWPVAPRVPWRAHPHRRQPLPAALEGAAAPPLRAPGGGVGSRGASPSINPSNHRSAAGWRQQHSATPSAAPIAPQERINPSPHLVVPVLRRFGVPPQDSLPQRRVTGKKAPQRLHLRPARQGGVAVRTGKTAVPV